MKGKKRYLILSICLMCYDAQAVPFAGLSGEETPDFITEYLTVSVTGNTGANADSDSTTGYWSNAPQTGTSTSNANILNSITFTATGLSGTESVDLTRVSFDYIRRSLSGSNPNMEMYIDTGNGYGASVLSLGGNPATNNETDAFSLPLNISLRNGESVTFGFSFSDIHTGPSRTHLIDNFALNGTFDLDSDVPRIDLNNNDVSDVWEYRFNATGLISDEASRNQDFDGDGVSNIEEAIAGTNPFDVQSRLGFSIRRDGVENVMLDVFTEAGKNYTLRGNDDLGSLWTVEGSAFLGNGNEMQIMVTPGEIDSYFYQVGVSDIDADGDGLNAWEELQVSGFTDGANTNDDFNRYKDIIQSALESSVSITTSGNVLYEHEDLGVDVTFTRVSTRSDDFLDLENTQTFRISDTTRVASNAASSDDYFITDIDGNVLADGVVTLAAGETSVTIRVEPIPDTVIEADEQLTLSVHGETSLNLWVADAEVVTSEDYIAISRAGHFLSQASMGGTPETISALANEIKANGYLPACEAWIDAQLALPRDPTNVTDDCFALQADLGFGNVPSININNFELVWWGKMAQTDEQLRHRMAYSLSQVFVTSAAFWANSERNDIWRSYTSYYDKLADAAFSNHRSLLQTISYDPFMGVYLSSAQNRKANPQLGTAPDENYAREVMQLFSCGVYSQNQNGEYLLDNGERVENYDNDDITEMAKVFTGLGLTAFDGEPRDFDDPRADRGGQYIHPMTMFEEHHETSSKTLLDGTVLAAGAGGNADISTALDRLALHPSTAPHLSRLLIKRFTSSNPSGAYIGRVTEAWRGAGTYGNGEVGNFVSIIKAILLDPEAREGVNYTVNNATGAVTATPTLATGGRIKEPIIKWLQFYRFAQSLSGEEDGVPRWDPLTKPASNDSTPDFGQIPMRAPSVFNYYDSEYSPSVGDLAEAEVTFNQNLTSPESEILSPFVIRQFEEFYDIVNQDDPVTSFHHYNGVSYTVYYNYLSYLYSKNTNMSDFIDDINLWFCNGQISPDLKGELVTLVNANGGATRESYAKILSIIFNSSDFSVSF